MLRRTPLFVLLAFAIVAVGCADYGEKLEFGSGEVYYTDGVTKEEAQKLGEWLKENEFFQDDDVTRSVQLRKEGERYQFRVVVQEEAIDKPETADIFRSIGALVSSDVLGGAPVDVHLTDEYMETKHELPMASS